MEVVNLQKIQTTGMIPSVITDFILLCGFFYRPISGLWYFKPIPAIPAIPANPPCTAGPRMAQDARAPADRGDLGVAFLRQLRRWFATVAYARDRLCDSSGKRLRQLRRGCDSWAKDWFSDDLPLMSVVPM